VSMMKRRYVIVLAVVACLAIGISAVMVISQKKLNQLAAAPIWDLDLTKKSDGVYEGEYSAFPIRVKVEVTVAQHKITKIDIIKHDNGKGAPAEAITDQVIQAQTLNVDTISGATYSSKAILKAIENAFLNKELGSMS